MSTPPPQVPTCAALFGVFGLWPSLASIQGLVTHLVEGGFHTLTAPPWPPRPGVDEPPPDPAWVDAYLHSRFHPRSPVTTATPGLWLRHAARPWGHHLGGIGDFCTSYGLAGLWLAPSLGPNAPPEGHGGCVAWLPGDRVTSFAFHLDDPWPDPAQILLRTPILAMPRTAHALLETAQRGQDAGWPRWMMDTLHAQAQT